MSRVTRVTRVKSEACHGKLLSWRRMLSWGSGRCSRRNPCCRRMGVNSCRREAIVFLLFLLVLSCVSLFVNFCFVRFSSFCRFLEPEMVFDRGLKLCLVSTNRLSSFHHWQAYAADLLVQVGVGRYSSRSAMTKQVNMNSATNSSIVMLFIFYQVISSQKVHGTLHDFFGRLFPPCSSSGVSIIDD